MHIHTHFGMHVETDVGFAHDELHRVGHTHIRKDCSCSGRSRMFSVSCIVPTLNTKVLAITLDDNIDLTRYFSTLHERVLRCRIMIETMIINFSGLQGHQLRCEGTNLALRRCQYHIISLNIDQYHIISLNTFKDLTNF